MRKNKLAHLPTGLVMALFKREDLDDAVEIVARYMPSTPAHRWPLLGQQLGLQVIVKHENHTPTGSFKARGGLVFVEQLRRRSTLPKGLVTATRGNHGQPVAIGARQVGIPALIVVPEGNSVEKNAAMEAFGAEVLVAGRDFDESRVIAAQIRVERDYLFVPSFHRDIVKGVATYALELLSSHPDLDVVFVPIGMGSGICGLITVRDMLGLKTEIVGVVAENAPAFAESYVAGRPITTETAATFADGMACREPQPEPLEIIRHGAADIIRVSEDELADAMRMLYTTTHNLAEGAGAAPLAALQRCKDQLVSKKVALVQTGGNIDMPTFAQVLKGQTPGVYREPTATHQPR